jgi:hypothetical protein
MASRPPIDVTNPLPARQIDPPPWGTDPALTRATVSFHTNDDDKNDDTPLSVFVWVDNKSTMVARLSGFFGRVEDHGDLGPLTLLPVTPITRSRLRKGQVEIVLGRPPPGIDIVIPEDTWRFGFFVDFYFADGGHLFSYANDVVLNIYTPNSRLFDIR